MGLLALIFGLLGAVCAIVGILTAVGLEMLPALTFGGESIGQTVFDAAFWWGISVILFLACIAIYASRIAKGYE